MALRNKVFSGIKWNLAGKLGSQLVSILSVVVLSRLIAPEYFGIIAIASIFIGLASLVIDFGVKPILIQIKDLTDTKVNTFFTLYLIFAGVVSLIIFLGAGLVVEYYNQPELKGVLAIMCWSIPINTYNAVQVALLTRDMKFKQVSMRKVISQICSFVVVVILYYAIGPLYALAFQPVLLAVFSVVFLLFVADWTPKLTLKLNEIRSEFAFGRVLFLNNIFSYVASQIDNFFIGKKFGEAELGYYQRGYTFIMMPTKFVSESLSNVLNPFYAKIRDDRPRIGKYYLTTYRITAMLLAAILIPIIIEPTGFILIVFGDQWVNMSEYMRIFAIAGYIQGTNALTGPILLSLAEVSLLKQEIVLKRMFLIIAILIAVQYSVLHVVYARLLSDLFNKIICFIQMFRSLKLSFAQQISTAIKAQGPSIALGGILILYNWAAIQLNMHTHINFIILCMLSFLLSYGVVAYFKPGYIQEILDLDFVKPKTRKFFKRLNIIR